MWNEGLVLLSGGQDSTTCLYWAKKHFQKVHSLAFDYNQRHKKELDSASHISQMAGAFSHKVLHLGVLEELGNSALVGKELLDHGKGQGNLPATFVPGRNLLFLTLAAAYAWKLGVSHLITGVCQTDYAGYPDCRDNTIKSLQVSLNLGFDSPFTIHTPLMWLTKKESVELAQATGAMEALAFSHTCYEGVFPPCQKCNACQLRARGFEEAGIMDPLLQK